MDKAIDNSVWRADTDISDSNCDLDVELSASTRTALEEFYVHERLGLEKQELLNLVCRGESNINEKAQDLFKLNLKELFPEDWQMSQFWYDQETSYVLAKKAISLSRDQDGRGTIACISCPSVYHSIGVCGLSSKDSAHLYEYDKRFQAFGDAFLFYDYNNPEAVPQDLAHSYSVIVADPPFLSNECLQKISLTIKKLKTPDAKIILCTGSVMEKLAEDLLGLEKSCFVPKHNKNLGNKFSCFTNFTFS